MSSNVEWLRIGRLNATSPEDGALDASDYRDQISQFLTGILQAEHLALLAGSGLSMAAGVPLAVPAVSMSPQPFEIDLGDKVTAEARRAAEASGRGEPNVEDFLNAALGLLRGLRIMSDPRADTWSDSINKFIREFIESVVKSEGALAAAFTEHPDGPSVLGALEHLLLALASRTASRERLHVFTTNYDRLVEYVADSVGLHVLDSFVGTVRPTFRTPRLSVDVHYNPPGLRGEPRYLEGVIRFTKLHGSIDWRSLNGDVFRTPTAFGAAPDLTLPDAVLVYPNAAKDTALSAYPYSELFRDFSASIVRPQSAVMTYGYGFGDQHINLILRDMLRIPSTHLVIVSHDDPGGRIRRFVDNSAQSDRISVMVGASFANLRRFAADSLPGGYTETKPRDPEPLPED